jgi:hypothetical protein
MQWSSAALAQRLAQLYRATVESTLGSNPAATPASLPGVGAQRHAADTRR